MAKLLPLLFIVAVAAGIQGVSVVEGQTAGSPAPVWVITAHETIGEEEIAHAGDIIITDGGTLELLGTRLIFSVPGPYEPTLRVMDGGRVFLNGTANRPAILQLDRGVNPDPFPGDTSFHWRLRIESDGELSATGCDISGTGINQNQAGPVAGGHDDGIMVMGLLVMRDCVVHDTKHGMRGHSPGVIFLENVTLWSNREFPVAADGADVILRNLTSEAGGMSFNGGSLDAENIRIANVSSLYGGFSILNIPAGSTGESRAVIRNMTITSQQPNFYSGMSTRESLIRLDNVSITGFKTGIKPNGGSQIVGSNVHVRDTREDAIFIDNVSGGVPSISLTNSSLRDHGGKAIRWETGDLLVPVTLRGVEMNYRSVKGTSTIDGVAETWVHVQVVNSTGAPVPGVDVVVEPPNSNPSYRFRTNASGEVAGWVSYGFWVEDQFIDRGEWTIRAAGVEAKSWLSPPTSLITLQLPGDASSGSGTSSDKAAPFPGFAWVAGFVLVAALWMKRRGATR